MIYEFIGIEILDLDIFMSIAFTYVLYCYVVGFNVMLRHNFPCDSCTVYSLQLIFVIYY